MIKKILVLSVLATNLFSPLLQAQPLNFYWGGHWQGVQSAATYNGQDDAFQRALDSANGENSYAYKQNSNNNTQGWSGGFLIGVQKMLNSAVSLGLETGLSYFSNSFSQMGMGSTYLGDDDTQNTFVVDSRLNQSYLIPLLGVFNVTNPLGTFFVKAGVGVVMQTGQYNVIGHYSADAPLDDDVVTETNTQISTSKVQGMFGIGLLHELQDKTFVFIEYNYVAGQKDFSGFVNQKKTMGFQTIGLGFKKVA